MKRTVVLLWIVQGLLALLFVFAGGMKLVLPIEAMKGPIELPGLFLRFIGVAEVLGAVGLILPSLLRIRPGLTPLAACGPLQRRREIRWSCACRFDRPRSP